MYNAVQYAHQLIKSKVQTGDLTVDATAGQGYDTLLLAHLVGSEGLVISYDIQKSAIQKTRSRLEEKGFLPRVKLINRGHETLADDLAIDRGIRAVTFNLGYLPGSDRQIITKPETTIKALQTALDHLLPAGIITIVSYHRHPGGAEELNQLKNYLLKIEQQYFDILQYQFINQANQPPVLFAIEAKKNYPRKTFSIQGSSSG